MLLELPALVSRYKMGITGVLHCGAHLGEEAAIYHSLGVNDVWWVEGNPQVIPQLRAHLDRYGQKLIEALVFSKDNVEIDFNVTNYDGMSSSILEFGTHPQFSPDTVFVDKLRLKAWTIDTLVSMFEVKANFLNMDLQGAELHALWGGTNFIQGVDYIMTEVNREQVYVGAAQVSELDALLVDFERMETYWVPGQGWGDACYVRRTLL